MAAIALFVGMPWAVFSGIAKIKAASAPERRGRDAGGLRRSDLEDIVRTAVEDATQPLVRRLETLEAIVTDEEPEGRLDPAVLADALEPDLDEDAPVAARRRTRA